MSDESRSESKPRPGEVVLDKESENRRRNEERLKSYYAHQAQQKAETHTYSP